MSAVAVQIDNLSFKYEGQKKNCVEQINLVIKQTERFGLFGPNGAGKTTLMALMTGLLKPLNGSIMLHGKNVTKDKSVKNDIGYVPQDFAFYPELSPIENLHFFGAWYGLKKNELATRCNELLKILGLDEVKNKPVKYFSGGMKRRINIAIGVIHRPRILFLDEPTTGVDAQSRAAIIDYLKTLHANGSTIIYTSHQLNEAEDFCRNIALINDGKIIVNDEIENLLISHNENNLEGLYLQLTGKQYRD